jgi:hypothetical protein
LIFTGYRDGGTELLLAAFIIGADPGPVGVEAYSFEAPATVTTTHIVLLSLLGARGFLLFDGKLWPFLP